MRPNKPNPPVLLTTSHKVAVGRLSDFSVGARGLVSAAQRSPGCLGGSVSGSPDDDRVWQIVCRFTDEAAADAWARSASNARWGRYMQKYSMQIGVTFANGVTPLDQSTAQSMSPVYDDDYDSDDQSPARPPQGKRRIALAIFVFVVFFGAVITANGMAVKMLPNVPPLVRILVLCFAMTGLAAWVLPPLLGRAGDSSGGSSEPKPSRKRSKAPEINTPRTRRRAPEVDKRGRRIESERERMPEPAPVPVADPPRVGGRRGKQAPRPMPVSSTMTTIEPVGPPQQSRRRADRRPVAAQQSAQRGDRRQQPEPVRLRPLNVDPGPMMEAPTPAPALAPLPAPRGGFFPTSPHKDSRG